MAARGGTSDVGLTTFRVLGPIEMWWDGERLPLGGPRQVTLLAVLLLHANRAVARDELVDVLWGSDAASGSVKRLQVAVARMRKALEPVERARGDPVLRSVGGGYALSVGPGELDADLFAAHVQEGHRLIAAGAPERAVTVLREAEVL